MGVKRFFKIRGALHISDANEERDPNSQDKFWKVRPLLEAVRSRCLQLVPLEQNSIDEQMVPFTGRIAAKQFVKGKPNPEGVKVFVRCSFDGLAHDFEFYQGKGTGVSKEHAHLGLGGSVVMRLVESLPKAQNIKCYMDNYFTSVKLFLELKKIGILASGTIRGNRLAGCVMKTDKEMKKEGRGSYDERVSQNDEVVLVRWQDNGTVNMASTHLGVGNIGTVRRWSESQKVHVDIDCPEVVLDYNKYMGGVDKLDFIMSLYPMRTRTKKWPVRVISHFASFALSNSWLEYLRDANKAGLLRKETLDMMAFQTDVANCLLNSNKPQKKRGRPSNDNSRTVKKKLLALTPQQKAWGMFAPLLNDLFKFLAPLLRIVDLENPIQLLYKGTLRVLLVLLHDFPQFLCDFHYDFCDLIAANCIQMHNLILSAFPQHMRLPDPFTSNLKVEVLPEITQAP
ncbi:hypothetical protein HPB51_019967 [Rhipicephalus microplus]|uniref:Piggybac transposable element-derived n=1 Tax=Rhipicephalus microplus TaxID=6941 RepID=A0A9J6DBK0_RHIMP|nr:hypothetical protein HPB51_019967 [Rhipicephalus microplus]